MAIEKMSLIEIVGSLEVLDEALSICCDSELFHIKPSTLMTDFIPLREANPYAENYRAVVDLLKDLELKKMVENVDDADLSQPQVEQYLKKVRREIDEIRKYRQELQRRLANHNLALMQAKHLAGLDLCIADIIGSDTATARFGKLPADNFIKLPYFTNQSFFFFDFDHDIHYYWGFYVAPNNEIEAVDRIFDSLYFEVIDVLEYAHTTPHEAIEALEMQIEIEHQVIANYEKEWATYREQHRLMLEQIYTFLKRKHDVFSYRQNASAYQNRFHLHGFVPKVKVDAFVTLFDDAQQILCEPVELDSKIERSPPISLRINRFFRPFEMFVKMYGLPNYYGYDPTTFIGILFVLLFGIMFGDVGQGAGVIIAGGLMWKYKEMSIGKILMRCGISSMVFGLLYGSVFGVENNFIPFWEAVGFGGIFPLHILDSQTSMQLIVLSLGLGILLICFAMTLNVVLQWRRGNSIEAIFSSNGIVGLVFYTALIAMLVFLFVVEGYMPVVVLLVVIMLVSLALLFLKEPLSQMIERKRRPGSDEVTHHKFSVSDSIFELIEVLLSYCTNTLSFLRVGGFVLSHAALMLVVLTFAEMAGAGGNLLVMILGNLFVMLLEGLLVCIQVLRLLYYEMFSRFYETGGEPYMPIKIQYSEEVG